MSNPLLDVLQTLVNGINRECGLALTKDDVVIGLPIATTANGRNTELRVEVPAIDLVISTFYRRLDLTVLFQHFNLNFVDDDEETTLDLIPKLASRRQIPLDPTDFQSATILRTGPNTVVSILADPESLRFHGFVNITLQGEEPEPEVPLEALLSEEGLPLFSEEVDFLLIVE